MSAGGIRDNPQGIRLQVAGSVQRQTPETDFGSVLGRGIRKTADAILTAGQAALPYVPGGAVVSAAVTGLGRLKSSAGGQSAMSGGANATSLATAGTPATGGGLGGVGGGGGAGSAFNSVAANAAGGDSQAQLMMATREMQEMNMSFNLQYLQLQQKMQSDNRQFTLLSNIMKTKHDTAKNAINNVR